jgi:DNA mismatch repair protein MutS
MDNTTPMLRQYLEIKKEYPGTILFFRLGDFYEMFNEDAVVGARELEITLTARQKDSPRPIPMCGVPHHSAAGYIARLVKKGYRVAICEQAEPAGKDVKLVKREVVRVITPGTAIDAQLLESRDNIYLGAISGSGEMFGIAFLDLSTGEFSATQIEGPEAWQKASAEIESYAPRELLFPESLTQLVTNCFAQTTPPALSDASNVVNLFPGRGTVFATALTSLDDWLFHLDDAVDLLKSQFGVRELTGFGLAEKSEAVRAAAACLRYARETQRATADHIAEINYFETNDFMVLDAVTLRNLDLIESRAGSRRSLLGVIDSTVTGMGARLLKAWLARPSIKRSEIQTRLEAVGELTDAILRDQLRYLLKEVSDLERLVGRLNLGTATPRELLALSRSLGRAPLINQSLADARSLLLQVLTENISELPEIRDLIRRAIDDEPSLNIADGGVIRPGFDPDLDELRAISTDAKRIIAAFEEEEKRRTGIVTLKVKFNSVFGYFIEVSKGQAVRVPADYERRQTLTNAERYTTPQLKEWEEKVLGAEEKILELEAQIFRRIRAAVQQETRRLQTTARALATLDALASLAEVAQKRGYVCPVLHDGDAIEVCDGRHPIVEAFSNQEFIPNSLRMNNSTDRLLIITGPNMGGKSTILRQVALIQILAQIGSFVPARSARLPIVDRVWTRVGASDDLASGRSTFMVEMTETAAILYNATPRSLILLDEIGRGTSTFDGLSIAWAVAEYLHDSPHHSAKTLFATHYHELTELAENLPGARNYQITAAEKDGDVVFLHKLEPGKASKSYGIAVAQLAGLPPKTIARAREVLDKLEKYELAVFATEKRGLEKSARRRLASQFSLFAISNENVIDELREMDLSAISEREAKAALRELQKRII